MTLAAICRFFTPISILEKEKSWCVDDPSFRDQHAIIEGKEKRPQISIVCNFHLPLPSVLHCWTFER